MVVVHIHHIGIVLLLRIIHHLQVICVPLKYLRWISLRDSLTIVPSNLNLLTLQRCEGSLQWWWLNKWILTKKENIRCERKQGGSLTLDILEGHLGRVHLCKMVKWLRWKSRIKLLRSVSTIRSILLKTSKVSCCIRRHCLIKLRNWYRLYRKDFIRGRMGGSWKWMWSTKIHEYF